MRNLSLWLVRSVWIPCGSMLYWWAYGVVRLLLLLCWPVFLLALFFRYIPGFELVCYVFFCIAYPAFVIELMDYLDGGEWAMRPFEKAEGK